MGFPRQEYWSGLPFPSPGLEPCIVGGLFTTGPPEAPFTACTNLELVSKGSAYGGLLTRRELSMSMGL